MADDIRTLRAEVKRLRGLAREIIDALDAEKTPDYGEGHDKAHAAALAMLNKKPRKLEGRGATLAELPLNDTLVESKTSPADTTGTTERE